MPGGSKMRDPGNKVDCFLMTLTNLLISARPQRQTNAKRCRIFGDLDQLKSKDTIHCFFIFFPLFAVGVSLPFFCIVSYKITLSCQLGIDALCLAIEICPLFHTTNPLLTWREGKMAGYWCLSYLRVYETRLRLGP